jgi:hypothetical protein
MYSKSINNQIFLPTQISLYYNTTTCSGPLFRTSGYCTKVPLSKTVAIYCYILPSKYQPTFHASKWEVASSNTNEYQEYFLGGKGGQCVGLTTLPPSCADWLEIWEPRSPGILQACDRPEQGWLHLLHKKWHSSLSHFLQSPYNELNCSFTSDLFFLLLSTHLNNNSCWQTVNTKIHKLVKPMRYRNITQNFRMAGQQFQHRNEEQI